MAPLPILLEDNHLIVLNKPAGLMVEDDRYKNPSLISQVEAYLQASSRREVFIANVHRLDRPASGVLLFARKKSSLKILSEQFQNRQVRKMYLAITDHCPASRQGMLSNYLYKDVKNKRAVICDKEQKESQLVKLEYSVLAEKDGYYLWKIHLLTGKYHQIRAQLSHLGCPIVGDKKYGSLAEYDMDKICLHAWQLAFIHPQTNASVEVSAPLPLNYPWACFRESVA